MSSADLEVVSAGVLAPEVTNQNGSSLVPESKLSVIVFISCSVEGSAQSKPEVEVFSPENISAISLEVVSATTPDRALFGQKESARLAG